MLEIYGLAIASQAGATPWQVEVVSSLSMKPEVSPPGQPESGA
ncbi:hypothetical protein ACFLW3_00885 [Chloroflexota bacterium]